MEAAVETRLPVSGVLGRIATMDDAGTAKAARASGRHSLICDARLYAQQQRRDARSRRAVSGG